MIIECVVEKYKEKGQKESRCWKDVTAVHASLSTCIRRDTGIAINEDIGPRDAAERL